MITHSPGVKRQYSGTLGKIGNCQLEVSVHAIGERGTLPLGWRLYLPEEWCQDRARRRKAKIPEEVVFETKPQLAADLCELAAGGALPAAPILADSAYGDDAAFHSWLSELELEYVVAVRAETNVFGPETEAPWFLGARLPAQHLTPGAGQRALVERWLGASSGPKGRRCSLWFRSYSAGGTSPSSS